jgi:quercetin dioxygenase-like cupin family protein
VEVFAILKTLLFKNDYLTIKITSLNQLKSVTPKQLAPGLTGYYAHGSSITFGLIEIKAGSDLSQHQHPHEQITYVLEGQLDMIIGGTHCSLTAGMYYVIPSNTPHGAIAVTDCKIIDVFNPVREDYLT